jgi:hypothetical protein
VNVIPAPGRAGSICGPTVPRNVFVPVSMISTADPVPTKRSMQIVRRVAV